MGKEFKKNVMYYEETTEALEDGGASKSFDDDGRVKRTGILLYIWIYIYIYILKLFMMNSWNELIRDTIDGERTHHNGGDRVRGAVSGVGHSAAGMGRRPRGAHGVFVHHLLHLHPPRRLLPLPWPPPRHPKLYLHGCCSFSLRYIIFEFNNFFV